VLYLEVLLHLSAMSYLELHLFPPLHMCAMPCLALELELELDLDLQPHLDLRRVPEQVLGLGV